MIEIFLIRKKVAFLLFQGWELKEPVQYKFKEFPYYETRKNEALFREYVKACEQVMEAIYIAIYSFIYIYSYMGYMGCHRMSSEPCLLVSTIHGHSERENCLRPVLYQSSLLH